MSVKGKNFDFMCLFILKQKGHLLSFVIVNQHFGCYVDNEGKITITNKTQDTIIAVQVKFEAAQRNLETENVEKFRLCTHIGRCWIGCELKEGVVEGERFKQK